MIVELAWPIPMLAPAEIESDPLDPLRLVTTFALLADRLIVPPEALVVPDITRFPIALTRTLLPLNAVALFPAKVVVLPLKLRPVKLDVPE